MSERSSIKLIYLAPAERDLRRLKEFLITSEVSENRANEIIKDIVLKIGALKRNPLVGFSIGGKYGINTPYRGLICGKYIAIYQVLKSGTKKQIEIRRIYHCREDYIAQLLSS